MLVQPVQVSGLLASANNNLLAQPLVLSFLCLPSASLECLQEGRFVLVVMDRDPKWSGGTCHTRRSSSIRSHSADKCKAYGVTRDVCSHAFPFGSFASQVIAFAPQLGNATNDIERTGIDGTILVRLIRTVLINGSEVDVIRVSLAWPA